jgi:hypothetical protein
MPSTKFCPPTVRSVKAGHDIFRSTEPIVLVMSCRGTSSTEKSEERELGASVFTTSKTKHTRLLPSRSVSALKTPPVRFPGSMPVKLLTVPVLPPILWFHIS